MEIFKFENSENKFPGNESLEMEKFDRLADWEFGNLVISKFGKSSLVNQTRGFRMYASSTIRKLKVSNIRSLEDFYSSENLEILIFN